jgi:hypothetical protein
MVSHDAARECKREDAPADVTLKNGAEPSSAKSGFPTEPKGPDFQFERQDWTLFRSIGTLSQKAGVPPKLLRRLVLKELTDNGLDHPGANVIVGVNDDGVYFVGDDGPGIAGTPEQIADLFSISRPLTSSKLWRLPLRGALGNGLRVVAGTILASGGSLVVFTRNQRLVLAPKDDGTTDVQVVTKVDFAIGTRIELTFGDSLPTDSHALVWANAAIAMAKGGSQYGGKTSPYWYDPDHFFELLQAAGDRPVRDLIANLDGCTGARAGEIAADFKNTPCNSLSRPQAGDLLLAAREAVKPVRPERLGSVGTIPGWQYICTRGSTSIGTNKVKAEIPFVVETWAEVTDSDEDDIALYVNRTPITGDLSIYRQKKHLCVDGCGLDVYEEGIPKGPFSFVVNVTTPYCPITTDGKEPDLAPFEGEIADALMRGARKAKRSTPQKEEPQSQKSVFLDHLNEVVADASGAGRYRFTQRRLFYVIRKHVNAELGIDPKYANFKQIITDHEAEHDDIEGMTRDPRGTLYHPHVGLEIPIGTLAVEQYERPAWRFNKILYIEKEGFFEILKAARWPERHDCALLTSKGYASRAVKDLLDYLAEDNDEPLNVFTAHDCDGPGGMIYQTLQEATRARPRRLIEIIDLGLHPWEAEEMCLEAEKISRDRDTPVADYIKNHPDGEYWTEWLQTHRIELDAMSTEQFIEWLDQKMFEHESKKVVPPKPVIVKAMRERAIDLIRQDLTKEILRKTGLEDRVAKAFRDIRLPKAPVAGTTEWLDEHPEESWTDYVDKVARVVTKKTQGRS